MKAPAPDALTAWSSGGTVYVLAFVEGADAAGNRTGGVPLTLHEASALHYVWLRDLMSAARRRETATVDLLKRFETDLREAIRASYRWRRAASIAA